MCKSCVTYLLHLLCSDMEIIFFRHITHSKQAVLHERDIGLHTTGRICTPGFGCLYNIHLDTRPSARSISLVSTQCTLPNRSSVLYIFTLTEIWSGVWAFVINTLMFIRSNCLMGSLRTPDCRPVIHASGKGFRIAWKMSQIIRFVLKFKADLGHQESICHLQQRS